MATPLKHPVSSTKLRNALKREAANPDALEIKLSNIRINRDLRGCSGFVTDTTTGRIVYVHSECDPSTDHFINRPGMMRDQRALYRTAEHTSDFRGGRNNFSEHIEDLPRDVLELLGEQD